jgi:hypothetical protein
MRTKILIAGLAALTLAACGSGEEAVDGRKTGEAKAPASAGMDGPRPGLWRITTRAPGMPEGVAMPAFETCVTRQDFSEMQRGPGQEMPEGVQCSEQSFRRDGDAMVGRSVCTMPDGVRAETDTRVTGDLSSRYSMEVTTRMTPAPIPSMAETTMTLTAERIGDCPAGSAAQ